MLSAFAHAADGDLGSGVPGAVALRRDDPNLSAAEKARLQAAAALIHAATPRRSPSVDERQEHLR
jgi:hypothetical protein